MEKRDETMFENTLEGLASTPAAESNLDQNQYLTREEFQLYHQAQEKKGLIDKIKGSLLFRTVCVGLSGTLAIIPGLITLGSIERLYEYQDIPAAVTAYGTLAVGSAFVTLFNTGITGFQVGAIAGTYKQIRSAENELKQIRENPAYERLDLIE